MELLIEADPVIRQMVPSVLDAAGLRGPADRLRGMPAMLSARVVERACELLREAGESSDVAGEWTEVVSDATFWGEGALLSASSGEEELFVECMERLRRAIERGWRMLLVH